MERNENRATNKPTKKAPKPAKPKTYWAVERGLVTKWIDTRHPDGWVINTREEARIAARAWNSQGVTDARVVKVQVIK